MNPSLRPSPTRSPLYFIVRMINTNHHRGSRTNEKTMDVLREFPRPSTFPGFGILTNLCQKSGFQFSPRKLDVGIIRKSSFGAVKSRNPFAGIRAAATVEAPDVKVDSNVETTVDVLSCPICYKPLIRKGPSGLNMSFVSRSGFQCGNCKKAYSTRDVYIDLTVTAGSSEYDEYRPLTTELFRSPLVAFVYERGWRQNFASGGFPGPDEEFRMAQKILEPAAGGLLVDASCGSGLFSRRFANCGLYSGVVALDFSENMLRQCYEFIKQDKALSTANLALVRADISRLPFTAGSVDAVHAGAALQCWPSPSSAVAEISRVLRPGGVFVATTFVLSGILDSDIVKPLRQAGGEPYVLCFLEFTDAKCALTAISALKGYKFDEDEHDSSSSLTLHLANFPGSRPTVTPLRDELLRH